MEFKGIFNNVISSTKRFNNNLKIKKFYTEKTGNGKSYIASSMDKALLSFLIWIFIFVYIYYKSNSFFLSTIISTQFIILYIILIRKINKRKLEKNIENIDKSIILNKVYKDIIDYSPDEFVNYIKDVLEKCTLKDTQILNKKDIDLIGILNEKKLGIKCYQHNKEHNVSVSNVRSFFLELRELNIDEGIIITTSDFSDEAVEFSNKVKEHKKIKLINLNNFLNIMKKANMYPSKKQINEMILEEISDNKKRIKDYGKNVISQSNMKKCFILGIVLLAFSKITPFAKYYRIVAYVLIFLGLVSLIKSIIIKIQDKSMENIDEEDSFI
ncbi:mrr restriction system domain-containing protein [Gottschalkia purinilytica]|uniref:Mrr restriction system domain-containing protein n=1 Tax=Gottschalkia purinilytica TaxID=1503 RepID=A0A0L0WEW3_GOTPU|nr:restriction endonuclease [Gottschalkia purinilytica]KNF09955.1 mrr restriction system domain-containing protein [Gottschalkia purinilytica]